MKKQKIYHTHRFNINYRQRESPSSLTPVFYIKVIQTPNIFLHYLGTDFLNATRDKNGFKKNIK